MQTEAVNIGKVIPYARNPRRNDAAISKVAASLQEFGWQQPIVVDADMVVVAGHTRLEAARSLGMTEVPVHVAAGLTPEQVKAYRIADNRVGQEAEWDEELLRLELGELESLEFPLDLTGFDADELGVFMADPIEEGKTDPDEVPELPDDPVTKPGDVWLMGTHRLMCGDSTSIDAVDALMDGVKANICFTSPPYNAGSMNINGQSGTGVKYDKFDDNQSSPEFMDFLRANLGCMSAVCDEVFYNIGLVQNNKRVIFDLVSEFGDTFKDVIYWKKNSAAPHIQNGVINNLVEFILCFGDGKRKFVSPQFSQGTYWNVIECANASGNKYSDVHKATFPVYLPQNIITNFTARNAVVVDCFSGTGTTIIAGEMTGRSVYAMDMSPAYVDLAVNRWEAFTGNKATLDNSPEAM